MFKNLIRNALIFLRLDLTNNLKYDRLAKMVLAKVLKRNSKCIDIGSHKGEFLDLILSHAPQGGHYAFEPIPDLHLELEKKYSPANHILPFALGEKSGDTNFNYVKNAPAYSGILKRKYNVKTPEIQEINVPLRKLDDLIPAETNIDFIKIDVEGAELSVLKGARKILKKNRPYVIFECGLGASDFYGTSPEEVYDLTAETGLKISLMDSWLDSKAPLTKESFCEIYNTTKEYYFLAHP
jgi:FkbM family methyltransferase